MRNDIYEAKRSTEFFVTIDSIVGVLNGSDKDLANNLISVSEIAVPEGSGESQNGCFSLTFNDDVTNLVFSAIQHVQDDIDSTVTIHYLSMHNAGFSRGHVTRKHIMVGCKIKRITYSALTFARREDSSPQTIKVDFTYRSLAIEVLNNSG